MNDKYQLKFSIINRVHNAEKFLRDSVESVLNQTYPNWELILVDDGSTDSCPQICDEYAEMDKRIKVIHQKNQGGAQAELTGYDNSTGEYIFTLDSDDTFEKNTLEFCYNKFIEHPDVDILLFGMNRYSEEGKFIIEQPFAVKDSFYDKEDFIEFVLITTVHGLIKVLKKTIVKYTEEELIFFKENSRAFSLNNDILLGFPVLFNADKTLVVPECFYNYRLHSNSSTHINKPYAKIEVALKTLDYLKDLFKKRGMLTEKFYQLIIEEVFRELLNNIFSICKNRNFNHAEIKIIRKDKRYKEICRNIRRYRLLDKYKKSFHLYFYIFNYIL